MRELPNYFLADLPDGSPMSERMLREACQTLKRNRLRFLAPRSTESLIATISELAADWLESDFPFRQRVLRHGPEATGFSEPTLRRGLDEFFSQMTADNLRALIIQDLGRLKRLDELGSNDLDESSERLSFARGPELLAHITGGVLPNPVLTSILFGLLLRSAQFVKCARGSSFIPRMFAHSLYAADPKLGACLELAEWKGGNDDLEQALYHEADCVTATGSDDTIAAIRHKVPVRIRFIGYGQKLSFAFLGRNVLGEDCQAATQAVARDVAAWDQLGCLSPHVVYVEIGGETSPEKFAELLAAELDRLEHAEPRGRIDPCQAAAIATRRSFYEVRAAAHSFNTKVWASHNSTAWTVIFEDDPRFQVSCLRRFVFVKSVAGIEHALQAADPVRGHVSTVGVAAGAELPRLVRTLADWGVTRVCRVGQMQNPPLTWRHDGRPALGELVTWTDWEV